MKRPLEEPSADEQLYQCGICLDVMFGKIALCRQGHGVCQSCQDALPSPKKCPTCRGAYEKPPTRGIMVEQIIGSMRWPCGYSNCGEICRGDRMAAHIQQCDWRPLDCPICDASVAAGSMCEHIGTQHHTGGTYTFVRIEGFQGAAVYPARKVRLPSGDEAWAAKWNLHVCAGKRLSFVLVPELGEVLALWLAVPQEGKIVSAVVCHVAQQRRLRVTFGGLEHPNLTASLLTSQWRDRRWDVFGHEDVVCEYGVLFHKASLQRFAVDDKIRLEVTMMV